MSFVSEGRPKIGRCEERSDMAFAAVPLRGIQGTRATQMPVHFVSGSKELYSI